MPCSLLVAAMKRREFIILLTGAAAWPITARSQQKTVPVIGFLRSTSAPDSQQDVVAFRQGLKEAGLIEHESVAIEARYADNQRDKLKLLANELVQRPVNLIVANSVAALVAKTSTATIPLVFVTGSDPVRDGLVANFNRPGGNVTGVVFITSDLAAKRLELLRQVLLKATIVGLLIYPDTPETETERKQLKEAAKAVGQQLVMLDVKSDATIESAFAAAAQQSIGAVLTGSGPFLFSKRGQIVGSAARHGVPVMYNSREAVEVGGLMSYGTSIREAYRQAGVYAGRIIKGEYPGELPVMQSSKFELVVNLKTAKALGLTIPPSLLISADEVIE
jgi:putative ABC transport system substrate-binding protein